MHCKVQHKHFCLVVCTYNAMDGYKSALNGLRHCIFLSFLIKGHRCLIDAIHQTTAFWSMRYSGPVYIVRHMQERFQCILAIKTAYFSTKCACYVSLWHYVPLFFCHYVTLTMSRCVRVPEYIVKYAKNGYYHFGSVIIKRRPCRVIIHKCHSIRQRVRFSTHSYLSRSNRTNGS